MPLSLSTPKHKIKMKSCLPFTYQLSDLVKATKRLCVTDPRERILGKTDMVVDFLLLGLQKPR